MVGTLTAHCISFLINILIIIVKKIDTIKDFPCTQKSLFLFSKAPKTNSEPAADYVIDGWGREESSFAKKTISWVDCFLFFV